MAPEGWHVPTDEEWKQLEMCLGMSQADADAFDLRGTDEGGKLKETGTTFWYHPNTGATNESGFSALPGGYRWTIDVVGYDGIHFYANFWSLTELGIEACNRVLYSDMSVIYRGDYNKNGGFSVRCVKD